MCNPVQMTNTHDLSCCNSHRKCVLSSLWLEGPEQTTSASCAVSAAHELQCPQGPGGLAEPVLVGQTEQSVQSVDSTCLPRHALDARCLSQDDHEPAAVSDWH